MLALLCTSLVTACSSLGDIELGGDEGRFTAGDDVDPPQHGDDADRPPGTGEDGGSSGHADDGPLQPPGGTTGTDDGESTSGGSDDDGTEGTEGDTDPDVATEGDDGTTGEPPTNGIDSASETTGDTDDCTDAECLPACDPTWDTWCGQPCDEAEGACAAEGGIVVSCDAGVWTCAAN